MQQSTSKYSLIEQARVTDGPQQIKIKLKSLIQTGEIKTREIVKETTFSPAVISQALSGTYEGDVERVDEALMRFYRRWIMSNLVIETAAITDIQGTFELAWKRKVLSTYTGDYGEGKTKAVMSYVVNNDNYSVYLTLTSTTTQQSLVHRIAEALNISSRMQGSLEDKLNSIIRELQRNPRLIVVDEADNLKAKTLAILKDIYGDQAAERCAIVLVGTEELIKLLHDPALGYLESRIGIKRKHISTTATEAKEIINMWPHRLEDSELSELWKRCAAAHYLRSLTLVMSRAYDNMQLDGKKAIESKHLDLAKDMVLGR
jgi:DNA transposition AAA+ family ATPase